MKSIDQCARILVFVLLTGLIYIGIHFRESPLDFLKQSSLAARTDSRSSHHRKELDAAAQARTMKSYGKLPMLFEANRDQTDARVKFIARGGGYTLFLTDNEAVLRLRIADRGLQIEEVEEADSCSTKFTNPQSAILRMRLVGANRKPRISGVERLQTKSNYFIGNDPGRWRTKVANFAKVKYESVYPGVDLDWYGNQRQLEHDFIVAPGADPKRIKFSFAGADAMTIDGNGALVLRLGGDDVRLLKPVAWQEENGERREVECRYEINRSRQVGFRLGDYDRGRKLVIDPVLAYSTYIGGAGSDQAFGVAVDSDGFAYITGLTDSADFPGPSPIQSVKGAQTDAFVLKLNQAGDAVIYGAWLGGQSSELGVEIAVDATGAAVIVGGTSSDDFPTKNALQAVRKGPYDAFIAKLNSAGNDLIYSTYLGGSSSDAANALALDANGNAYVTGHADSLDFPLKGAFQNARQGSVFYASNDSGGGWNASSEGLDAMQVIDIAIDPTNPATVYVGTERGAFKSVDGGGSWLKSGADLNFPVYQIAIDPLAPANVYSVTTSFIYKSADGGVTWNPISVLQGVRTIAISPTPSAATIYAATSTQFFKSVDGGATWMQISLPPSGFPTSQVSSIAIDPTTPTTVYAGSARGVYRSADGGATWTFLRNGLPQSGPSAVTRLAVSKTNPATILAELLGIGVYKTTNGGADWTAIRAPAPLLSRFSLAIDPGDSNTFYVGAPGFGIYKSVDGGVTWNTINKGLNNYNVGVIAISPDSPSTVYAGTGSGTDAFVAKINQAGSELVFSSYLGGGGMDTGLGIAVDRASNVYVIGRTESPNFPVIGAYQPTLKGALDAFVTKVNPDGSAILWSTYLGGSGLEDAGGIAVHSPDYVFVAGSTYSTDFPTVRAIQSTNRSISTAAADAFISRFSVNDGSRLDFSTYLGGARSESATAIAVDDADNVYLTGSTSSTDFPVLSAVQPARGGDPNSQVINAFVTKLDTNSARLVYSTYLGGSGFDRGVGIATDGMNNVYVTGGASSTDFPTTPNSLRPAGFNDSFVAKLASRADLAIAISDLPDPVMVNNNLTYTLTVTNSGPDTASGVTVTDTAPAGVEIVSTDASQGSCGAGAPITCAIGSIAPNARATITIVVKPTATGSITNRATVASNTSDANESNNTATQETRVSTIPSIFGRVTTDGGAGLGEVTVALTGAQRPAATTAIDGGYQFAELPARANYTVTPSRQGYVFNPTTRAINDLQSDQRADFQAVVCAFSISPLNQSFAATGGSGSVTITSPDQRCTWTARSDAPWIKITSAATGNGNGMVTFSVEPTVGARSGTLTIAGARFTVWQEFSNCGKPEVATVPIIPLAGATMGEFPPQVIAGDFNGDRRGDLVYWGAQPSAGVLLTLSKPGGGYDAPVAILTGSQYRAFISGDFNNDGRLDLAAVGSSDTAIQNGVTILLGNGAGGFSAPQSFATGPGPTWLATGDFNRDGKADLAVTTGPVNPPGPIPMQYNVSVLPGDGAGRFGQAINVPLNTTAGAYLLQIESGDFNGDGLSDFAAAGLFGQLHVLMSNGAGGFNVVAPQSPPRITGAMTTGDFNGDDRTDLAVVADDVYVLLANESGGFNPPAAKSVRGAGKQITAGDFNLDGKTDLATTAGNGIAVLYALGGGKFDAPAYYVAGNVFGINASTIVPLPSDDYNLDGRPDLLVPVVQNREWSLAALTSTGTGFNTARRFPFTNQFGGSSVTLGDLNGDGVNDLVAAIPDGKISITLGDWRGGFLPPTEIIVGSDSSRIAIHDLNRDGRLDLVLHHSPSKELSIMLGDGRGGFTLKTKLDVAEFVSSLAIADFNNDGNPDLVANGRQQGLTLFTGDGQGNFAASLTGIAAEVLSPYHRAADFNGDGAVDLLVYAGSAFNCEPGSVRLYLLPGDGRGGFGSAVITNISARVQTLIVSDINGDGKSDLILYSGCGINGGLFVAFASDGNRFAVPVSYPPIQGGLLALTDATGDGKPDLVLQGASGLQILPGDGNGAFGQPVATPFNGGAVAFISDQDGDGLVDFLKLSDFAGFVTVHLNRALCLAANSAVLTSSASYDRHRASSESIVTLFGANLAAAAQAATSLPLPTTLANTSVKIKDSAGVERLSPLFFVSPSQINHLIPKDTSPGAALLTVINGANTVATGTALITATSPGLFSADSSGQGLAAAVVLRVRQDNSQVYEPMVRFDPAQNRFVAIPIDLSDGSERVFLVLFGTGLRNRSALANVSAKIGGENAEVSFAGSQGALAGLDQVNLRLLPTLRGSGDVFVELVVDGKAANSVTINIK